MPPQCRRRVRAPPRRRESRHFSAEYRLEWQWRCEGKGAYGAKHCTGSTASAQLVSATELVGARAQARYSSRSKQPFDWAGGFRQGSGTARRAGGRTGVLNVPRGRHGERLRVQGLSRHGVDVLALLAARRVHQKPGMGGPRVEPPKGIIKVEVFFYMIGYKARVREVVWSLT